MTEPGAAKPNDHVDYLEFTENEKGEGRPSSHATIIASYSEAEQTRIMRRVDRRLVPILGLLYFCSLMDRVNTGLALVAGMGVDLELVGYRYNTIVLMFFITSAVFQFPSTVLMRKIGPRAFLFWITFLWGLTSIAMGFVRDWTDMIPLRLILGIFEAGLFPGCLYLLSCWYTRYELQKRNALWFIIGSATSAFSGILSYGFSQMGGLGSGPSWWGTHLGAGGYLPGIAGWRFIFIMEGSLTCGIAFVAYFFIVNFPELSANPKSWSVPFLNARESALIVAKIENDRLDVIPEEFSVLQYLKHALDLKVLAFATIYGLNTTVTYGTAYFLPVILSSGMGFGVAASQCLSAPPTLFAGITMMVTAWYSDRCRLRSPFIICHSCCALIGLVLLGFPSNVGVRYFGAFLAVSGANTNISAIVTWQANNIRGQWKRAICSATLVLAGNIGGIIGTTVFRTQDKPKYRPGILTTMTACALIITLSLLLDYKFIRANRRAAAGGKVIGGLEGFRYTL